MYGMVEARHVFLMYFTCNIMKIVRRESTSGGGKSASGPRFSLAIAFITWTGILIGEPWADVQHQLDW